MKSKPVTGMATELHEEDVIPSAKGFEMSCAHNCVVFFRLNTKDLCKRIDARLDSKTEVHDILHCSFVEEILILNGNFPGTNCIVTDVLTIKHSVLL